MKFLANDYEVCIELKNGIYRFLPNSATGKTYLTRILNVIDEKGVLVVTYEMVKLTGTAWVAEKLLKETCFLIVFDRFDLYPDKEIMRIIKDLAMESIILIDVKMVNEISKYLCTKLAGISFDNTQITVYPVR